MQLWLPDAVERDRVLMPSHDSIPCTGITGIMGNACTEKDQGGRAMDETQADETDEFRPTTGTVDVDSD